MQAFFFRLSFHECYVRYFGDPLTLIPPTRQATSPILIPCVLPLRAQHRTSPLYNRLRPYLEEQKSENVLIHIGWPVKWHPGAESRHANNIDERESFRGAATTYDGRCRAQEHECQQW